MSDKKSVNVSINSDLIAKAKALKTNLSVILEATLIELVKIRQCEFWKQQHRIAIETCNQLVEEHGTFSGDLRNF